MYLDIGFSKKIIGAKIKYEIFLSIVIPFKIKLPKL